MTIRPLGKSARLLPPALLLLVASCQGGVTLPADGSPGRLRAVSGFDQQGAVGAELPQPLVVQVMDGAGRPVPDVTLRFQTDVPAARLTPAQAATNDSGYAAAHVRLGTQEGTQIFEALLAEGPGSDLRATFTLVALADQPPDEDNDDADNGGRGNEGERDDEERGRDDKDKGRGHGREGHGGDGHGDDGDHHGEDD